MLPIIHMDIPHFEGNQKGGGERRGKLAFILSNSFGGLHLILWDLSIFQGSLSAFYTIACYTCSRRMPCQTILIELILTYLAQVSQERSISLAC